jgi:hypothetical protein
VTISRIAGLAAVGWLGLLLQFSHLAWAAKPQERTPVIPIQIPEWVKLKRFPLKNLIPTAEIATESELKVLKDLAQKAKIDERVLYSDFDGDSIRDFTLSGAGDAVILSAEDPDWDNDQVPNLEDLSLGKQNWMRRLPKLSFTNHYQVRNQKEAQLIKELKTKGITLLASNRQKHDLLVFAILLKTLAKLPGKNVAVRYFHATTPGFTRGSHVYFSYSRQAQSIEFYPAKFHEEILELKNSRFKDAQPERFIYQVVMPIVAHSLAHELGHAISIEQEDLLAKKAGWSWEDQELNSKYLVSHRLKDKELVRVREQVRFRGKSFKEWLALKAEYEKDAAAILGIKNNDEEFKKAVRGSTWYTETSSLVREYQLSFMKKEKIPSYYSVSDPDEWKSEQFAACLYQIMDPECRSPDASTKLEVLVGFRPDVADPEFCKKAFP